MSKLRLTCLATAAWASATLGHALEAPGHEAAAQKFECGPTGAGHNRIVAADLPRTVYVTVMLTGEKATGLKVAYLEDNGEKSDPADKTKSWRLVTMPSGHDYHWWAVGSRQPNLLMHGRLFKQSGARGGENQWLYYEEQFETGLKTSDFQVACVAQ